MQSYLAVQPQIICIPDFCRCLYHVYIAYKFAKYRYPLMTLVSFVRVGQYSSFNTMMTSTNLCEAPNTSIIKLPSKNIFHRDFKMVITNITHVVLPLLKSSFVKTAHLYVLIELVIPEAFFSNCNWCDPNGKDKQKKYNTTP